MLVSFHDIPLIPLFKDVDQELVITWLNHCDQCLVGKGERLIERDQLSDRAFLLLKGELMVHLDPSPPDSLGVIQPGECVGEVSSLCGLPASAYVSAAVDSVICAVPRNELITWARQSHQFSLNLITLLGRRLSTSNRKLTDEQQAGEELRTRSITDPLTGVLNRGWISSDGADFQRLFAGNGSAASVLMIDIDHFKALNDSLGHAAGDVVLRAVAGRMASLVRSTDVLLRWGGEEFLIFCPDTRDVEAVTRLAQRLCDAIGVEPFRGVGLEAPVPVTVSIGVAHRLGNESWDALVDRADQALYAAKAAGRHCVMGYDQIPPQA